MRRAAQLAAAGAVLLGVGAGVGWVGGLPLLASLGADWIPMAPSSAVLVLVLGCGTLALAARPGDRRVAMAAAVGSVTVCALSVLFLVEFAGGFELGIERALVPSTAPLRGIPTGRISPLTAGLTLLGGVCLLLMSAPRRQRPVAGDLGGMLAALVMAGGGVVAVGYALGVPALYGGSVIPMALPTALALLLVGVGLLGAVGPHLWGFGGRMPGLLALGVGVLASFAVYGIVESGEAASPLPHVVWHGRAVLGGGLLFTGLLAAYLLTFSRRHSETVRAAQAVRLAEERLRAVVETAPDAIVTVNDRGVIVSWNPAAERLFGYAASDAVGLPTLALIPERLRSAHLAAMERASAAGGAVALRGAAELSAQRRDGSEVPVELSVAGWRSGDRQYYTAIVRDVSERARMQEGLLKAQRLESVAALAGGVAHDFNNAFQGMVATLELLRARRTEPDAFAAALAALKTGIERSAGLTRQLLLFARREVVKPEALDLNRIVADAEGLLASLARDGSRLEIEVGPGPLPVNADRGQLVQVMTNLVANAMDAMAEGGAVTLRTGRRGDAEIWLEVRDRGTGMAEDTQRHLFEPFYSGKRGGSGLGLAVTHGIVAGHGGRIEVETALGSGSTFRVVLPAGAGGAAARHRTDASSAGTPGRGERILLVEDEAGPREGLVAVLTMAGFKVTAVASGEDALEASGGGDFDVLLTDLRLPGIDGPSVARALLERSPALRVILMSGYTEDEAVKDAVKGGSVRFLQKPFGMDVLTGEILAALDS